MSSEKVNTVYIVPNSLSKNLTLRKIKNEGDANIIDASLYLKSSRPSFFAQSSLPGIKNVPQPSSFTNCINNKKLHCKNNPRIQLLLSGRRNTEEMSMEDVGVCQKSIEENHFEMTDLAKGGDNICKENEPICSSQETLLNNALKDVLEFNIGTKRAAHIHGIKHSLLMSKINSFDISQTKGIQGADPALTIKEESHLVDWIRTRYKSGFPIKKIDLINRVADIVSDGRITRFKGGVPGEKWFNNFIARNPMVRTLGPISRLDSREIPSKRSIVSWFQRCLQHLEAFGQKYLLSNPQQIGSVEELSLCLVASKSQVVDCSQHSTELYLPNESSGYILTLIGACADGVLIPPMPIFSCRRPPPALINSIPSGWGIGLSKDGNINKEVVHSYFKNILIPWLMEQERLPFILFIDRLKSSLSVDIADFCAQKGLLIYNFYPNSCSIIQPLHLAIINNIKRIWNSLCEYKNDKEALLNFAPTLSKLFSELVSSSVIVESFRSCGIYPFNPKAPDYSNCLLPVEGLGSKIFKSNDFAIALEVLEDTIGQTKVEIFKETLKGFKFLKTEDKSLYKVWHKLVSKSDVTRNQDTEMQVYRHEKIVRGAYRKLPRPDTYLMVPGDGEEDVEFGHFYSFSANKVGISDDELGNDSSDVAATDWADVDNSFLEADEKELGECLTSDNWKIRYKSRNIVKDEPDSNKEIRKLERLQWRKRNLLNIDENTYKKMKRALNEHVCIVCSLDVGKLIKCRVCNKHFHFECMKEDEQNIIATLRQETVEYDYICLTCSEL